MHNCIKQLKAQTFNDAKQQNDWIGVPYDLRTLYRLNLQPPHAVFSARKPNEQLFIHIWVANQSSFNINENVATIKPLKPNKSKPTARFSFAKIGNIAIWTVNCWENWYHNHEWFDKQKDFNRNCIDFYIAFFPSKSYEVTSIKVNVKKGNYQVNGIRCHFSHCQSIKPYSVKIIFSSIIHFMMDLESILSRFTPFVVYDQRNALFFYLENSECRYNCV